MAGSLFGAGDFGDDLYSLAYNFVSGIIEVSAETYASMSVYRARLLSGNIEVNPIFSAGFTRIIMTSSAVVVSFSFSSRPFMGQFWIPIGEEDSNWTPTVETDEFWQPIVPNQGSWNG